MSKIQIKTESQILKMRAAGLVVAAGLDAMCAAVTPGITTAEIDAIGRDVLTANGAKSNFLNYGTQWGITPFPGVACVSPNEVVVHGMPGARALHEGDIVSIDFGAIVDGWHGDAARTVAVGTTTPEAESLIEVTRTSLWAGVAAMWTGAQVSDIGHEIEQFIKTQGRYGIVRDATGHGIGSRMHMDPDVPNYGHPGRGPKLVPGMTLAVEPMVTLGTWRTAELDDDWTMVTTDSSWAAHWENTIAICKDGLWVLTEPDGGAAELARLDVPLASLATR
ncbi:MAG: type I methionyl aminopeptidase [Propionibacteriaceae bacterium]|nr:type I methionyl aminopeptidase [Propionibacteriaceae bacterium]